MTKYKAGRQKSAIFQVYISYKSSYNFHVKANPKRDKGVFTNPWRDLER